MTHPASGINENKRHYVVSARVDKATYEALKNMSAARRISVSKIIQTALMEYSKGVMP